MIMEETENNIEVLYVSKIFLGKTLFLDIFYLLLCCVLIIIYLTIFYCLMQYYSLLLLGKRTNKRNPLEKNIHP